MDYKQTNKQTNTTTTTTKQAVENKLKQYC